MKRPRIHIALAVFVAFVFLPSTVGYAKEAPISVKDKSAFKAGAIVGDGIMLASINMPISHSKIEELKYAMDSLGVKDDLQQSVLRSFDIETDTANTSRIISNLSTIKSTKESLTRNLLSRHGFETYNNFFLGLATMTALEACDQLEETFLYNPLSDSKLMSNILTASSKSIKDVKDLSVLNHEIRVEINAVIAIKPFQNRIYFNDGVKRIRSHLVDLLALYNVKPMTLFVAKDGNIYAIQQ